jgi:hypothetical protein
MFGNMSFYWTSHLLDLPPAWLALLFQHVACGPGGLANAAALSQTCKFLHSLYEGPAVKYNNLFLAAAISSPGHPVWQWLAKRIGCIAGLRLELRISEDRGQLPDWMQALQTLSGIPGAELRIEWLDPIARLDHPCIALWLKQHGQFISQLKVEVHVSEGSLKLKDFCEAAAPCKSIDLTIGHAPNQVFDMSDLEPVTRSLHSLLCGRGILTSGSLRGASTLNSMSHLTALHLDGEDFTEEEPWGLLAKLTGLQRLELRVGASGDPSPLSALTGLTYLDIERLGLDALDGPEPFSFSSLQPLSTLLQLEELLLGSHTCAATSLQGLAGLSSLRRLILNDADKLRSLEGISPGVTEFSIRYGRDLECLAGIEGCTGMERLSFHHCGVSSLQPLWGLSNMKLLEVFWCCLTSLEGLTRIPLLSLSLVYCKSLASLSGGEYLSALKSLDVTECGVTSLQPLSQLGQGLLRLRVLGCKKVQEVVLELPHVKPTADVLVSRSNVKEVMLAGGVRKISH